MTSFGTSSHGTHIAGSAEKAAATRILVICNDSAYFMRHRLPVVERLVDTGAQVMVVTGGDALPRDPSRRWSYIHVPVERFSFHPARDFSLLLRSLSLIWSWQPQAVHLITLKPAVFSGIAAIVARVHAGHPERVVITIPGLGRLMSPVNSPTGHAAGAARDLVGRAMRFLSRRAGVHFTFETSHDRDHWLRSGLIRADNSTVINGAGVDPKRFHPRARAPKFPITVLFASRLLRSKGLDAFIELARKFADRSDVRFVVAGMTYVGDPDGYAPAELATEDSITFLGEIGDMAGLLRETDLVCLPTRYGEGIPRILIEAAATGLPCLATELKSCAEIVEHGKTGFLVPNEGIMEGLVEAVSAYLADPDLLRLHGEAAYHLFLSRNFDEDAVVERFVTLLMGSERQAGSALEPDN